MKVLILATDIYTRGGIARYTWTLASSLGRLAGRENVHLLALLDGPDPKPADEFLILKSLAPKLNQGAKLRYAWESLRLGRSRYDLVICSHLSLSPIAAAIKLAWGTPFWVVCHGTEAWPRFSRPVRSAMARAELVMPVSRFTAEKLRQVNRVPPDKLRVIYNAIPAEFLDLLEQAAPVAWGEDPGDPMILSIGNLGSDKTYKGFDTVIRTLPEVLAAVPEARYVIVGTGEDRYRLEAIALELGVLNHVRFAGEITDAELAAFYKSCDLFAMPSRVAEANGHWSGEGFGRVYAEAALAGKPVVGSLHGGAAEAVVDGETGFLVDALSVSETAQALIALLADPRKAWSMGQAGRSWAREHFTQAALLNSLNELLTSTGYLQASRTAPARAEAECPVAVL